MERRIAVSIHDVQLRLRLAERLNQLQTVLLDRTQKRRRGFLISLVHKGRIGLEKKLGEMLGLQPASDRHMQRGFSGRSLAGLALNAEFGIVLKQRDEQLRDVVRSDGLLGFAAGSTDQRVNGSESQLVDGVDIRSSIQNLASIVRKTELDREVQRGVLLGSIRDGDKRGNGGIREKEVDAIVEMIQKREMDREISFRVEFQLIAALFEDLIRQSGHSALDRLVDRQIPLTALLLPVHAAHVRVASAVQQLAGEVFVAHLDRQREDAVSRAVLRIPLVEVHVADDEPRHTRQSRFDR